MRLDEDNKEQIRALLVGREITKVSDTQLMLDGGTILTFIGHDGGCACSAGCYDLTELNDIDNVITSVEFVDEPSGDDYPTESGGFYRIYVFADNVKVNLATFEGSDGNGYYGTGYSIDVQAPQLEQEGHKRWWRR